MNNSKTPTTRMSFSNWLAGDDCIAVEAQINGSGRGDGYDVEIFQSESTGAYYIRVYSVRGKYSSWYSADTLEGARAVGRAGYTPGFAPGAYRPRKVVSLR